MSLLFVLLFFLIFPSCDKVFVSDDNKIQENNYTLSIGEVNEQYITILYSHEGSPSSIGGFQFNIEGLGQASLSSAAGGIAQENNFTIEMGNNIIIGFSFSGSSIPNGNNGDILTKLFYEGDIITTALCINNIILSDSTGNEIPALIIECN